MLFHVQLEKTEDGWLVAECPALPGCISQGRDEQEAIANIKEAIVGWLWAEDQKTAAQRTDQGPATTTVLVSV
ncbi:MAG: type II toxin-antitoxin system HicB family antitoxin [Deltaproteobacteria bacterium]|nr:type II toxin-antitoxin system HicB family antitoxin [Deltaproteobacteria bacterium]